MKKNYLGFLMCAASLLWVAGWQSAVSKDEAPAEWDGLVKRKIKGLDLVYVRPDVEFPAYKKIMLDPVQVEFSKNWKPNSGTRGLSQQITAEDMQRIKDGLAGMVRDGFSKHLTKAGYGIATAPDDETIRVSAGIAELYINAPEKMSAGRSKTYTTETGSMVLIMEIRDSPTGQLLARVVDRHTDNGTGTMQWTTSVTNRAEADRAISMWASKLVDALDRLNGKGS